MEISHNLNLQLKQKLSLSREMLLSLELIQLPLVDLRNRIEKEILENPALELKEKKRDAEQNIDNIEESFSGGTHLFEDSSSADISTGVSPGSSDIDLKRSFLEGAITTEETLYEHLMSQLSCQNLTEDQKKIGQSIISLIDDEGFFKDTIEDVFEEAEQGVAQEVLEVIQLFDPPGIATPGIREALLFQIESMKEEEININAYKIVQDHFDLMAARKDRDIAKKLKISVNDVLKAFEFLSKLNPFPGREFATKQIKYIIPDAYVYKREDSLVVEMNEDILPALTINSYINEISKKAQGKKKNNEQQKYVNKKIQNANQFINLVNYRNKSLFKLVLILVKFQEKFFHNGPKHLKPLTMKEVAEDIGLSESTVSRLASSKYIQTEWGLHEIKYFFSNSIGNKESSDAKSAESVREMIKEIFNNSKGEKISDQKIADILNSRGIKIARRTVAKYRKLLNILPSHQRNLKKI